jgi:hypothetical protein
MKTLGWGMNISGFRNIGEPIEECDDADEIRGEHAVLLSRAIVSMRKLTWIKEEKWRPSGPSGPPRSGKTNYAPLDRIESASATAQQNSRRCERRVNRRLPI